MKKLIKFYLLSGIFLIILTACVQSSGAAGNVPTPALPATPQVIATQTTTREAQVESVEIRSVQGDPQKVNAIVRGSLSDSCTSLGTPQVSFESGTFLIQLSTVSPVDRGCIQIITPYEQTIPLDTSKLTPGSYTVSANGISTSFNFPIKTTQQLSSLKIVVQTTDGSLQVASLDVSLNPNARPTFNNFLPYGGPAEGNAYVLDSNQSKAVVTDGNGFRDLVFIQSPTTYGLAVWPGDGHSQPRLAWATQNIGGDTSSTIKVSNLDGTVFDTILTQDPTNPPSQLVAEFWSTDGQWLYFSKEPMGIGGYILFSGGSSLYKININTKEIIDVIPTDLSEEPVACLDAISTDFRYVAEHCAQNLIRIRDLTSGGSSNFIPPQLIANVNLLAGSARFSPDGKKLAYAIAVGAQNEKGWVAVSDTAVDNSKVIMTSQAGSYYTVAGWLDDQTLLVQSTNPADCSPFCKSELWTVKADGSELQKAADGSFITVLPNDAIIQLPAGPAPTPASQACTDAAEYVGDDGLDGTTYAPNTAFTKTWTVKNIGTCTWDSRYLVYQVSGVYMTQQPGYWLVAQGQTVAPGESVDIRVGMTSYPENGTYRADWGLKNPDGEAISIKGGTHENTFYVKIKVSDGTDTGNVNASAIDISPEQGSGEACTADATYFVHAYISTDGPATVPYEIDSSAGQIPAGYFEDANGKSPYSKGELVFDKADTKRIDLRFVGPYPYPDNITVMLKAGGAEWINTKLFCP